MSIRAFEIYTELDLTESQIHAAICAMFRPKLGDVFSVNEVGPTAEQQAAYSKVVERRMARSGAWPQGTPQQPQPSEDAEVEPVKPSDWPEDQQAKFLAVDAKLRKPQEAK